MREKALQRRVLDLLKKRGAWFMKVHGTVYGHNGRNDVIWIYRGRGGVFELKKVGEEPTKVQDHEQEKVREAGGIAATVYHVDQVTLILDGIDRELGGLPAGAALSA
jgi:hypothetical protein